MKKIIIYLSLCVALLLTGCAKEKHVCEVIIQQTEVSMSVGEVFELTAEVTVTGKISELGVDWSSSSDAIASVSTKGMVTAHAKGLAVITATAKADASKKVVCYITVE